MIDSVMYQAMIRLGRKIEKTDSAYSLKINLQSAINSTIIHHWAIDRDYKDTFFLLIHKMCPQFIREQKELKL